MPLPARRLRRVCPAAGQKAEGRPFDEQGQKEYGQCEIANYIVQHPVLFVKGREKGPYSGNFIFSLPLAVKMWYNVSYILETYAHLSGKGGTMRDNIYTIPVSEVFEPKCGCPICRLRDTLENRCVEYIMGAAMMEPDIRIETNRLGFCTDHFEMMLGQKNRLSLALMLESHLQELRKGKYKDIVLKAEAKPRKRAEMGTVNDSCFVCSQIESAMGGMLNTVMKQWERDADFRKLFGEQEYICLPHAEKLLTVAHDTLGRKEYPPFKELVLSLLDKHLESVGADVSHFCKMFDYRNAGPNADWGNSRDSIERAILALSTRDFRSGGEQ